MARINWVALPEAARAAVAERTGTVLTVSTPSDGANSAVAAQITTDSGHYFVKGIPTDHPQARTQNREAQINPYLPAGCPRLLWRVQAAGWDLLGFELITGRPADFTPSSPDLPSVAAALAILAATPSPDIPLKTVQQRWSAYLDPELLDLFAGDRLLHTDMAPHNVLISDAGDGLAHLIDWAWPTRGPAWVDPAVWVIRLIDAGHSPDQAEGCAAQLPAWHTAPAIALDAFADANATMWRDIAQQAPHTVWKASMADSAKRWAHHRGR